MLLAIVQLLMGLAILFAGSELLVRGGYGIARSWKTPAEVVSLTIPVYGASISVLMLAMQAAATGSPDIAVGIIIGSPIATLLLVTGILAYISPQPLSIHVPRRDISILGGAAALLTIFAMNEDLRRGEGWALLLAMGAYLLYTWRTASERPLAMLQEEAPGKHCSWCAVAYALIGLGLLSTGADISIDGSAAVAHAFGIAEGTIGLTVVATACTLPVLFNLVISHGKQPEGTASRLVSISILNFLGVSGLAAIIGSMPVSPSFLALDLWIMLAVGLAATVVLRIGKSLGKRTGMVLVALFLAYVVYQYLFAAGAA